MIDAADLAVRLARLETVEEVQRLKAHYCDVCDDGYDPDALAALFTSDAVWDGGRVGRFEGREAIRGFFARMPTVLSMAIHHVTNPSITVSDDGQRAEGRWYLLQAATLTAGNRPVWLAGRYHDRFERVEGRWLFSSITITTRFLAPYETGWGRPPFAEPERG
jgi:ketosteroid isomerase-like protein